MRGALERGTKAVYERHHDLVTEQFPRQANVGFAVAHVAVPAGPELRVRGKTDDLRHRLQQLQQAEAGSAGDVHHLPAKCARDGSGEEVRMDRIGDEGEVAGLAAVAEDRRAHP